VEPDRAWNRAAPVERNGDRATLDAACLARRQDDRSAGLRRGAEERRGCGENQEETATHEARQGTSAGVPFLCPVSVLELEP